MSWMGTKNRLFSGIGPLARNVLLLSGGTAAGQVIIFVTMPVVARLFDASDFGVFAVFTSILSTLLVVSSLRFELAIPVTPKESDAGQLTLFCLALTLLSGAASVGVGFLWLHFNSSWAGFGTRGVFLWLLPLGVVTAGSYQVLSYWSTRKGLFASLGVTKVIQSVGQSGVQLSTGLMQVGSTGLALGFVVGRGAGIFQLWRRSNLGDIRPSLARMFGLAKSYVQFPIFNAPAALVSVLGTQAIPLFFSLFFAVEITGYFSFSARLLTIPAALLGQAVGQALFQRVAENKRTLLSTAPVVKSAATMLLLIGFPIFGIVFVGGESLFAFLFGPAWGQAGLYARLLAPWLFVAFVSSPLSILAALHNRQRTILWITLYETGLRASAIAIGAFWASATLAVGLYSAVGVMTGAIYIAWILRLEDSSFRGWLAPLIGYLAGGLAIVLALEGLRPFVDALPFLLVSGVILLSYLVATALPYYLRLRNVS